MFDRGLAAKTIRADVATDLRQQIANLTGNPAPTATVRQQQLEALRGNLRLRVREGSITDAALAAELDDGIVALGAAIERAAASQSPRPAN